MKTPLLALLGACGLVFLFAEAWAWQTHISGTAGGGVFNATAVDGAGNVVAAGYTTNTDTGNDFTVVKFDGASGAEVWRYVITGNASSRSDLINAVAIDGAGNVVAAGVIWRRCSSPSPNCGPLSDFLVVKLDGASGAEMWRQVIEDIGDDAGPTGVEDVANAVTIDGAGDVVAAGALGYGPIVVKLDGVNGTELWRQNSIAGGRNPINAVAVDGAGNVVAAGRIAEGPSASWDFGVVKYDGATGAELWRKAIHGTFNGSFTEEAKAVAIDGAGNVIAAGTLANEAGPASEGNVDFAVVKLDGATGVELWRRTLNGTNNDVDRALAVTVDGEGNAIAAGVTVNGGSRDFTVAKFDGASGVELWRQVISGGKPDNGALAVTADGEGNVVAAGFTANGVGGVDFTVAKFEGTLGSERWRQVLGSASGTSGQARAVSVDGAWNAIAAGDSSGFATVVKLEESPPSPPPDNDPPTVTITAPPNAAIVSGTIPVSGDASDNIGVTGVQFQLDGAPLGAEDTEAPYAVTWDTAAAAIGPHTLSAVARDAAGNQGTAAPVTVIVVNLPSGL